MQQHENKVRAVVGAWLEKTNFATKTKNLHLKTGRLGHLWNILQDSDECLFVGQADIYNKNYGQFLI